MTWALPLYSKSQVDRAGRTIANAASSAAERVEALAVVNNWRSAHAFPLNTMQASLRNRAGRIDSDALVAQRVKRLTSIEAKLSRFPGLRLSQVQDIGGCRAVVSDVGRVELLANSYLRSNIRHVLVRDDDYISQPKESGYRGRHLVYRYSSDRNATYNQLQIELQLRTRDQHAWATAVETVGMFTEQALKSSRGEADWLRFFSLMSSAIAIREKSTVVPGVPTSHSEIRSELRQYSQNLGVEGRLAAYNHAMRMMSETALQERSARYFLLDVDLSNRTLTVTAYAKAQLEVASSDYAAAERLVSETANRDVVLVSVDSVGALRRAYPNYFADTTSFLGILAEESIPAS